MERFDLPKVLFVSWIGITCLGVAFTVGLASGVQRNGIYQGLRDVYQSVVLVWQEREVLTELEPTHFLQDARYEGEGVTLDELPAGRREPVLISGFFGESNEIRLIRRDGTPLARWPVSYAALYADARHLPNPPQSDWNVDLHGAIAEPDGSVVFNFENVGLVKLDRCGEPLWTLPRVTHHSIEPAVGGGYWVPGRRFHTGDQSPFPPFRTPYSEDTVMHVAEDGAILSELSIAQLMIENDLESLLTLTGTPLAAPMPEGHNDDINRELFHLNDIEELSPELADDFPLFEAGDLMLSLRNRNLVLVFDPETRRIKWWQIGPWVRQHDPDFQPGGRITVFDNRRDGSRDGEHYGGSTVVEIDPVTREHRVLYGGRPDQPLYTNVRGKHQVMPGGALLLTEHEGGRIVEVGRDGRVLWEFVNRWDDTRVAELTEARAYPAGHFRVADWSCAAGRGAG